MHGQNVITDQKVALFPNMIIGHAAVMKNRVECFADSLTFFVIDVFDVDVSLIENGFASRPRFMISQARLFGCRMGDDQLQATHSRVVERTR